MYKILFRNNFLRRNFVSTNFTINAKNIQQIVKSKVNYWFSAVSTFKFDFKKFENGVDQTVVNKNRWSSSAKSQLFHFKTVFLYSISAGIFFILIRSIKELLLPVVVCYADEAASDSTETEVTESNDQNLSKVYSLAEVEAHKSKETGIWVIYDGAVYDITEFVDVHPGGDQILQAAGSSLEPFWNLYAAHKTPHVREILEDMRIGVLSRDDAHRLKELHSKDLFATDPSRDPALRMCSRAPFNAETPPDRLTDSFYTPTNLFFVRNHLPVPVVDDVSEYRLEISGPSSDKKGSKGTVTKRFTLNYLKQKFQVRTVDATLQCAGNRRSEMNPIKQVKGLEWKSGAISNAKWTGVSLREVLLDAGIDIESNKSQHVQFEGLDKDINKKSYGASIPIQKVLDPSGDVILAFEMNGEPLSRDHGFPLRVIVPGVVGARNVKWLSKIKVAAEESDSFWQQNDYKIFPPEIDFDNVDWKSAPAIQEPPIQSAICVPLDDEDVPTEADHVEVKGYAWAGGGNAVIRVDVSADGGQSWHQAKLTPAHDMSSSGLRRQWSWVLWNIELPVMVGSSESLVLMCRAIDAQYNSQPDKVENVWNMRGCLNNAWHRVKVQRS